MYGKSCNVFSKKSNPYTVTFTPLPTKSQCCIHSLKMVVFNTETLY